MKYVSLVLILILSSYKVEAQELSMNEKVYFNSSDRFVNIKKDEYFESINYTEDRIYISYFSYEDRALTIYQYDLRMKYIDEKKIYYKDINHSFNELYNLENELYILGKRFGDDNVLRYYSTYIDMDSGEIDTQEISQHKMLGKQNRKKYLLRSKITRDDEYIYIMTYSYIKNEEVNFKIEVFDKNFKLINNYKDLKFGIKCTNQEFMIGIDLPEQLKYSKEENVVYGVLKVKDESQVIKKSNIESFEMNYSFFKVNNNNIQKLDIDIAEGNVKNASYHMLSDGNVSLVGFWKDAQNVVSEYNFVVDKSKLKIIKELILEIDNDQLAYIPDSADSKSKFKNELLSKSKYVNSKIEIGPDSNYYMITEQKYYYSGHLGTYDNSIATNFLVRGTIIVSCLDAKGNLLYAKPVNRYFSSPTGSFYSRNFVSNLLYLDTANRVNLLIRNMDGFYIYRVDDDHLISNITKDEETCNKYVFKEGSKIGNNTFLIIGVVKPELLPQDDKKVKIGRPDYSSDLNFILMKFD